MKMPIFLLDSSFEEVQDQSKDHLNPMRRTFILNLFKICAGPPEGFVPQQLCHTPALMDINWSNLEDIFTHLILTHLSLLIWLVRWPWRLFSPHMGNLATALSVFQSRVFAASFDQRWLWSTQGQIDPKLSQNLDFPNPHFLALFPRLDVDFDMVSLT